MTDPLETPAVPESPPVERPRPPRRGILRRTGCYLGLVIWFLLVMSPCAVFILATQGEIRIPTGGAPGQYVRLWLVNEIRERGFGLSTASVFQPETDVICVQTDVRYLFWTGSAEDVSYCECYERPSPDAAWNYLETVPGACPIP